MRSVFACLLLVGCGHASNAASGGSGSGGSIDSDAGAGGARSTAGHGDSAGTHAQGGDPGAAGHADNAGAGTNGAAGTAGGSGGAYAAAAKIRLVPNIVAGTQPAIAPIQIGVPTAATLFSLKYYITSIQLCEDLELMGSGFNNPRGCIALYENQNAGSPDYTVYTVAAAQADTTPNRYIDLMSAEGQAALRQPITVDLSNGPSVAQDPDVDGGVAEPDSPHLRSFHYGLINFYRPIKVTAQFPIIGSSDQYFRTKSVIDIHVMPPLAGATFGTETVDIGDTLSGETQETTYMLNNGGALFTFQKPFVITQADVDAQTAINVDLVFNPENFGQAYSSHCEGDAHAPICDPVNHVAIEMPYVRMSPVPRKTGEHTRKERYLVDYDENSKLRVELYYNDADAEASVQGVDIALVYLPSAANAAVPSDNVIASNFVSQTGHVATNNASVTLLDYLHQSNLDGLRRRHDGTLTIHCQFTGSICPSLGMEVTRSYTYGGDILVAGD